MVAVASGREAYVSGGWLTSAQHMRPDLITRQLYSASWYEGGTEQKTGQPIAFLRMIFGALLYQNLPSAPGTDPVGRLY
ncbi:MAG: hypothetical protein AAF667_08100 [Pseudomonadota bacterium]